MGINKAIVAVARFTKLAVQMQRLYYILKYPLVFLMVTIEAKFSGETKCCTVYLAVSYILPGAILRLPMDNTTLIC